MKENVDFVVFVPQKVSSWEFYIKGKSMKLSEVLDETIDIVKKTFEANQDFLIPTKIKYILTIEPKDGPANIIYTEQWSNIKSLESFDRELASEQGVTFEEFRDDIQNIKSPRGAVKRLRRVDIHGKTRFILEGQDVYIDEHSPKDLYACWDGENVTNGKTDDPLFIYITRYSTNVELYDPAYYRIVIRVYTDIWFEDSEIGLANRNRLRNVFRKIYDSFDVGGTLFLSDRYSEDELKNVVLGRD